MVLVTVVIMMIMRIMAMMVMTKFNLNLKLKFVLSTLITYALQNTSYGDLCFVLSISEITMMTIIISIVELGNMKIVTAHPLSSPTDLWMASVSSMIMMMWMMVIMIMILMMIINRFVDGQRANGFDRDFFVISNISQSYHMAIVKCEVFYAYLVFVCILNFVF